jgi:phage gpG-like protein
MPRPGEITVHVDGIREMQRELRRVDPEIARELRPALKTAADVALPAARALAPRRTGRLAASLRASVSGSTARIRSPLPYAGVQHWGGTIRPRGTPILIRRTEFISRAVARNEERIVDELGDAIDTVLRRHNLNG